MCVLAEYARVMHVIFQNKTVLLNPKSLTHRSDLLRLFSPLSYIIDYALQPHGLDSMAELLSNNHGVLDCRGESEIALPVLHKWNVAAVALCKMHDTYSTFRESNAISSHYELYNVAIIVLNPERVRLMSLAAVRIVSTKSLFELPSTSARDYAAQTGVLSSYLANIGTAHTLYWEEDMSLGYSTNILLRLIEDVDAFLVQAGKRECVSFQLFMQMNAVPNTLSRSAKHTKLCAKGFQVLATEHAQEKLRQVRLYMHEAAAAAASTGMQLQYCSFALYASTLALQSLIQSQRVGNPSQRIYTASELKKVFTGLIAVADSWLLYCETVASAKVELTSYETTGIRQIVLCIDLCMQSCVQDFLYINPFPGRQAMCDSETYALFVQIFEAIATVWGTCAKVVSPSASEFEFNMSTAVLNALYNVVGVFSNLAQFNRASQSLECYESSSVWYAATKAAETCLSAAWLHLSLPPADVLKIHTSSLASALLPVDNVKYWSMALGVALSLIGIVCDAETFFFLHSGSDRGAPLKPDEEEQVRTIGAALTWKALRLIENMPDAAFLATSGIEAPVAYSGFALMVATNYKAFFMSLIAPESAVKRIEDVVEQEIASSYDVLVSTSLGMWRLALEGADLLPFVEREVALKNSIKVLSTLACGHLGCTTLPLGSNRKRKAFKCSGCVKVRYCSAACQKKDWKFHKHACKVLQQEREENKPSSS